MRQLGPLFGVSHSAAHRVIDTVAIAYRTSGINDQLAGREVMADGGYRGNREVIMPYRKPRDGSELPEWKQDYNARHRKVRARVQHCLARPKTYKILRAHRRAARTSATTAAGIAHLHNIAPAGRPAAGTGNACTESRDIAWLIHELASIDRKIKIRQR